MRVLTTTDHTWHCQLKCLLLARNFLGDEGATAIATGLRRLCTVPPTHDEEIAVRVAAAAGKPPPPASTGPIPPLKLLPVTQRSCVEVLDLSEVRPTVAETQ